MINARAPHGGRKRLAARDYVHMACRCGLIKEGLCDTCFSFQAYGAEVDQRMAAGVMTGHSTEPLVFPKPFGTGFLAAKKLLNRISDASVASMDQIHESAHSKYDEVPLSAASPAGVASKRDLAK